MRCSRRLWCQASPPVAVTPTSTPAPIHAAAQAASAASAGKKHVSPYLPALRISSSLITAGVPIYHSKQKAVMVLESVKASPNCVFWDEKCDDFLKRVKEIDTFRKSTFLKNPDLHLVIAVEGIDGVGKSTVVKALNEKLGGQIYKTPDPSFDSLRKVMRKLPEPLSRAWYCCTNYLAADDIVKAAAKQPVIVDRWWGSTAAMAVANIEGTTVENLPLDPAIYHWPSDLPQFDKGVLCTVEESIRVQRINSRGDGPCKEEKALENSMRLRDSIQECYRKMKLYEDVDTPTYMQAVNTILESLEKDEKTNAKLQKVDAKLRVPFTAEEIATVKVVGNDAPAAPDAIESQEETKKE